LSIFRLFIGKKKLTYFLFIYLFIFTFPLLPNQKQGLGSVKYFSLEEGSVKYFSLEEGSTDENF
jgi:hypothetical protein